jgi:hypothetical protein
MCLTVSWNTVENEDWNWNHNCTSIDNKTYWWRRENIISLINHKCVFFFEFWNKSMKKMWKQRHWKLRIPSSVARCHTSLTEWIIFSCGACKTIVVDPTIQRAHPSTPNMCNFSCNMKWASTALHRTMIWVCNYFHANI